MKRVLVAIGALAAGAVSAQSSVTMFGIVDAAFSLGRGSIADRQSLTNSGNSSSRLGFRGVESLGGGMSAGFWLEAGLNNDDGRGGNTNLNNQAAGAAGGGLTFNRRSTVSLLGSWGEVRLGRDYVPQFYAYNLFDPFSGIGVGATQTYATVQPLPTSTRASNSIGYLLPANLGGFYGQVMYHTGENPSNAPGGTEDDGDGAGIRIGYAAGPFDVAAAHGRTQYATGDYSQSNLAGLWRFGNHRVTGHITRTELAGVESRGWMLGGVMSVGAGEIKVAYSTHRTEAAGPNPRTRKLALGYVHNLSKRTALYTTWATLRNSSAAAQALNGATTAAGSSSSGLDIGLRHAF